MKRGLFIAIDGLDGTGKSTQCRLTAEWLRSMGRTVVECIDPGGTALGDRVRELLLFGREVRMSVRTEVLLFMASRVELVEQIIRPALDRGDDVITDRYVLASIIYQGHAGGLDGELIHQFGEFATNSTWPDLNIVLDLPVEMAMKRRGRDADRMESKGLEFAERVRAGFRLEAAYFPDHNVLIDASGDPETIQASIRTLLTPRIAAS
jgi:dTMP kinase